MKEQGMPTAADTVTASAKYNKPIITMQYSVGFVLVGGMYEPTRFPPLL